MRLIPPVKIETMCSQAINLVPYSSSSPFPLPRPASRPECHHRCSPKEPPHANSSAQTPRIRSPSQLRRTRTVSPEFRPSPSTLEALLHTDSTCVEATKMLQPSLRREGFSSVPDVTWADVGGLDSLKKELHRCIVRCIKQSDYYKKFGVDMQDGFLLFGPPGCGKTLIAKAVAHDAGANFIHIKGPELLSKYVGESESGVRAIFTRARTNAPCILFFDEVDALTTTRGKEGGWIVERVLTQLLIELDGADKRPGVYVIGATNRIDMIDEAVLRPGRFGKRHFVPLPGANERASILKALALPPKKPVSNSVDLDALARREECNNLTGADLASLVNEAAMSALEESLELLVENNGMSSSMGCSIDPKIEISHFEQALSKVKPSVSDQQRKHYDALAEKYSAS